MLPVSLIAQIIPKSEIRFNSLDELDPKTKNRLLARVPSSILQPEEGIVKFYAEVERLPRLEEGIYKIVIPELTYALGIVFPSTKMVLEHKRTWHPIFEFDKNLYHGEPSEAFGWTVDEKGFVDFALNLEATSETFSSARSSFTGQFQGRVTSYYPSLHWDYAYSKIVSAYGSLIDGFPFR